MHNKNHVRGKWGWRCDALYDWLCLWPVGLAWTLAGAVVVAFLYIVSVLLWG